MQTSRNENFCQKRASSNRLSGMRFRWSTCNWASIGKFYHQESSQSKKDGFNSLKNDDDSPVVAETKVEDEKEEWSLDTSEEAQKARRAEFLAAQLGKIHISEDTDKPDEILKNFMKNTTDPVSIIAELDRLQLKHGMGPEERCRILLVSAIDVSVPKTLATQFTTRAPLLKRLAKDRASGILLITSIERLLDSASPRSGDTGQESRSKLKEDLKANFVTRIGVILQKLYDMDVLSEETIVTWAQSPPEISAWAVGKDVAAYAQLRKTSHRMAPKCRRGIACKYLVRTTIK